MTKLHELRSTILCNGEANFRSRSDEHLGETPLIEWNSLTSRLIYFHWLNQCHSRLSLSTTRISWLSLFSHTRYRKVWKMTFCSKIKIVKTKGSEKKKLESIYKNQRGLSTQTLKPPLIFLVFSTLTLYLSIMPLFNKSEPIGYQFSNKGLKKKKKLESIRIKVNFYKLWNCHLFFIYFSLWSSIFQLCSYLTN